MSNENSENQIERIEKCMKEISQKSLIESNDKKYQKGWRKGLDSAYDILYSEFKEEICAKYHNIKIQ